MVALADLHVDPPGVQRALIDTGSLGAGGTATLVAAVAGKRLAIMQMLLIADAIAVAQLQNTTSGVLTGILALNPTYPLTLHPESIPAIETAEGAGLELLNSTAGISYGGCIVYTEKD